MIRRKVIRFTVLFWYWILECFWGNRSLVPKERFPQAPTEKGNKFFYKDKCCFNNNSAFLLAFLERGLGETNLWPPKNGFPQKYSSLSVP